MSEYSSDSLIATFKQGSVADRFALLVSTWFGIGLVPFAPGTWGTLGGIPLVFLLKALESSSGDLFLLLLISLAIWSSHRSSFLLEIDDPSCVVVDEVAGIAIALFLLHFSWASLMLSFFVFRLFDILKPFPIKALERLPGGVGIVADDIMAGCYTYLTVKTILLLLL